MAINRFPSDTEAEISLLKDGVAHQGARVVLTNHWAEGGVGAEALAHAVVETSRSVPATFRFVSTRKTAFGTRSPPCDQDHGASEVVVNTKVRRQIRKFQEDGGGATRCASPSPVLILDGPLAAGRPVRPRTLDPEVRLSAGAEFVVAVCGDIMTMPGLPKSPASERIDLGKRGNDRAVLADDRCLSRVLKDSV